MTTVAFQTLVLRALWAILFALLRLHAHQPLSAKVEEIEIELRKYV